MDGGIHLTGVDLVRRGHPRVGAHYPSLVRSVGEVQFWVVGHIGALSGSPDVPSPARDLEYPVLGAQHLFRDSTARSFACPPGSSARCEASVGCKGGSHRT